MTTPSITFDFEDAETSVIRAKSGDSKSHQLDKYECTLQEVLEFWFPNSSYQDYWFSNAMDDEIRIRFGPLLEVLESMDTLEIIVWIEERTFEDRLSIRTDLNSNDNNTVDKDTLLAIVICLDQFSRNTYRHLGHMIYTNDRKCIQIVEYFQKVHGVTDEYPINRRIFYLLPYRHQKRTKYLDYVVQYIKQMEEEVDRYEPDTLYTKKEIGGFRGILTRFKNATLQNYSKVEDTIRHFQTEWMENGSQITNPGSPNHLSMDGVVSIEEVLTVLDPNCFDYKSVCDSSGLPYYESKIRNTRIYKIMAEFYQTRKIRSVTVSLSGGVDSMVISYVLHHLRFDGVIDCVSAVHVDYGNRDVSLKEAKFVNAWCWYLRIPLVTRRIEHMRRSNENTVLDVDRSVYESATKELRFNLYRYAIRFYNSESVVLGHHGDDLSENVLMNVIRGGDLLDLYTMVDHQVISDVPIDRPLLPIGKDVIYEVAHLFEVPYLADTTSESCMRGTVRKTVIPALMGVDPSIKGKLMDIGAQSDQWRMVIESMVIQPILNKFEIKRHGIMLKWDDSYSDLPLIVWNSLLCSVFHDKVGTKMITRKNLSQKLIPYFKNKNGLLNLSNGYMTLFYRKHLVMVKKSIASLIQKLPVPEKARTNNAHTPLVLDVTPSSTYKEVCFNGWKIEYLVLAGDEEIGPATPILPSVLTIDSLLDGRFSFVANCIPIPSDSKVYDKVEGFSRNDAVLGCLTYGGNVDSTTKNKSTNRTFFKGLDLNRYIPKLHFFQTDQIKRSVVVVYTYGE